MTDKIATILIIALILDSVANIARMVSVEIAVKRQARMFKAESKEAEKRVDDAAAIVTGIVKSTVLELIKAEKSECSKCPGNGIDCADGCVKPREGK